MAKIRLENNTYAGEDGRAVRWPLAKQFTAEHALRLSAEYRSRGIKAEAIQNGGGESIEPRVQVTPIESQSYSWRGIVPQRISPTVWGYVWRDPVDDVTHSVTGANSEEVLIKIQTIEHPVYQRLRDSLPPEAGTPEAPAQSPQSPTPGGRVLRPGSNSYSTEDLPARRVEQSRPANNAVFEAWEKTAPASVVKQRLLSDPAFAAWYESVAAR